MDDHLDDPPVRTLKEALADFVAEYRKRASPELAHMIGHLEAELAERKGCRNHR